MNNITLESVLEAKAVQDVSILDILKKEGITSIESSVERKQLEDLNRAFEEFLALPEEVLELFKFYKENGEVDDNLGYIHRSKKKGDKESKKYVHYRTHEELDNRFQQYIFNEGHPAEYRATVGKFWHMLKLVYHGSISAAKDFTTEVSRTYPKVHGEYFNDETGEFSAVLRLLHYVDSDEQSIFEKLYNTEEDLADPHFDRGGFTVGLFETKPGLVAGKQWHKINKEVQPEREKPSLVFLGGTFFEDIPYPDSTELLGTPHKVVNKKSEGTRNSFVLFVDKLQGEKLKAGVETLDPVAYGMRVQKVFAKQILEQTMLPNLLEPISQKIIEVYSGRTWDEIENDPTLLDKLDNYKDFVSHFSSQSTFENNEWVPVAVWTRLRVQQFEKQGKNVENVFWKNDLKSLD